MVSVSLDPKEPDCSGNVLLSVGGHGGGVMVIWASFAVVCVGPGLRKSSVVLMVLWSLNLVSDTNKTVRF